MLSVAKRLLSTKIPRDTKCVSKVKIIGTEVLRKNGAYLFYLNKGKGMFDINIILCKSILITSDR